MTLHFELKLATGEVIDSNFDGDPATFVIGDGNLLPGFEALVEPSALALAAGAERIAVYKLYDQHLPEGGESFGLLRPDQTPRPAFTTWQTVAATFDDVHRRGSVARSVEIELDGGTLELVDSSIDVEVTDSGGTTVYSSTHPVNALELQREQGVAAYESGAVTRENGDGTGGLVIHEPAIDCRNSMAIVSIVRLQSSDTISIGGQASVRLISRASSQDVLYPSSPTDPAGSEVTIDISNVENQEAWRNYLTDEPDWSAAGDEFTCSGVNKVVVRETVITLEVRR